MAGNSSAGPRCAALVGPYLSGKTTLLESLLAACGTIPRKGSTKEKNAVGDFTPEARARQMSTELSVANCEYLGDKWTFLDCPGSIELFQETVNALMVADVAVIVFEPSVERAMTLAPLFKLLTDHNIPHVLFFNKVDAMEVPIKDVLEAVQAVSPKPLVIRELAIRDGDKTTGYVDLVSERAYKYKSGQASDMIAIPDTVKGEEAAARRELLEELSNFDDKLLEQLLEDTVPPPKDIYGQLTKDLREGLIVPVLLGAGQHDHGVRRLLKLLRHETPQASITAATRLGLKGDGEPVAQVFKTYHAAHTGKLSVARVWRGNFAENTMIAGKRIGGLVGLMGGQQKKVTQAAAGEVVGIGRMDELKTGSVISPSGKPPEGLNAWPAPLTPVFCQAIAPENRQDDVKLSGALHRLNEEDPAITYGQNSELHEMWLWGQGEIHLQIALEKLKNRYNVASKARRPSVPYKETIKRPVSQHGRFKRQTGGHGMFGDVHVDIRPLKRGEGFKFLDQIVGGAVPRNFIPAVETGVREYLSTGPFGFPVVDVSVALTDGQYHAVDSNDMSFKLAARVAMTEGMPKCDPVLLEPILKIEIDVPSEFTNKVHALLSSRRGQILGFTPIEAWSGWDRVSAHMPQSEIHDLIIELRSLSLGVGTYRSEFDHLQELTGRLADQIVATNKKQETAEVAS